MSEVSKDLIRLCTLLHQKNELQSVRHHARHAERRLVDHLKVRRSINKRKQLTRQRVRGFDILNKIQMEVQKLDYNTYHTMNHALGKAREIEQMRVNDIDTQLHTLTWVREEKFPRKFRKMNASDIKIEARRMHIANEQAKLDIALFTKTYRKEIAAITKRNGWRILSDAHSAFYRSVVKDTTDDKNYNFEYLAKGRDGIKQIAALSILEEAIVNA